MEIYTGIDIVEVDRIKKNIEEHADRFLNKVYTKKEIEYCETKKVNKFQSYAGRFAAKEAIFKAISKALSSKFEIEWKDIEVLNDANGRPVVNLYCESLHVNHIDVSISHINMLAVASVVVEM